MPSNEVSKKMAQDVAPPQRTGAVESHEQSAKASASNPARLIADFGVAKQKAGLNLNIFGALSGVFSGKSTKTTGKDGNSVEKRDDKAAMKGAGAGNLTAVGAADAEEDKKSFKGHIDVP
ncbi:hypothetical protein Q7P37_000516 [Cladosporium fusiforme]